MRNRVFINGNRAVISLVPGPVRLDDNGHDCLVGINGLILSGAKACRTYARAFIRAADDWRTHKILSESNKQFIKKYNDITMTLIDNELIFTIISAGRDKTASAIVLKDPTTWLDLAERLIEASEVIAMTERSRTIPVISPWKTTKRPLTKHDIKSFA